LASCSASGTTSNRFSGLSAASNISLAFSGGQISSLNEMKAPSAITAAKPSGSAAAQSDATAP